LAISEADSSSNSARLRIAMSSTAKINEVM